MQNKVVELKGVTIEEQVSKKGNKFVAMFVVVNGKKTLIQFINKEVEFAFYKAGIRL